MARIEMTVRAFFTTQGAEVNISPAISFVTDDTPEALEEFKTKLPDMLTNMRTMSQEAMTKCAEDGFDSTIRDMTPEEVTAYREEEKMQEGWPDRRLQVVGADDGDDD